MTTPTARSSNPAVLEIQAAPRRLSAPVLHEARTLLGAGAATGRIRFSVRPIRAVPSTKRCTSSLTSQPCRSTCKAGGGAGVQRESTQSSNGAGIHRGLQRRRVAKRAAATTGHSCRSCHKFPGIIRATHGKRVPKDLIALL